MSRSSSTAGNVAFFVALFATALALGSALAHALELVNKINLPRDAYFLVQSIYRGWDLLGFLLAVQLAGILAVVFLYRRQRSILWWAVAALAGLVGAQVVFWAFTFPANQVTQNWTVSPADWESLRRQWEYSHLAGAGFQVLAMAALIVAVLRRRVA